MKWIFNQKPDRFLFCFTHMSYHSSPTQRRYEASGIRPWAIVHPSATYLVGADAEVSKVNTMPGAATTTLSELLKRMPAMILLQLSAL